MVSLIEEKKASLTFDFSPILGSILQEAEKTGKDISALRGVLGLESPETIEKYQAVTGGTFYTMYGQTETSCLATLGRYSDRPGAAGRPIELAEVRLFDDYDRPVTAGQTGEICVRGPMVFSGYWNLPEDNARTFREGWHHTGDLGRFDEDGYLFYAGRKAEKRWAYTSKLPSSRCRCLLWDAISPRVKAKHFSQLNPQVARIFTISWYCIDCFLWHVSLAWGNAPWVYADWRCVDCHGPQGFRCAIIVLDGHLHGHFPLLNDSGIWWQNRHGANRSAPNPAKVCSLPSIDGHVEANS